MAKKPKKSVSSKPESALMHIHEAENALINYLTKMPDGDEVLRKAGITRSRLKVMMYDDEIYQAIEKRQDKLESAPWRLDPADSHESIILQTHLKEWWSEIILGAQNARWYGYSVLEAVYCDANEPLLHIDGNTITPYIGFTWIGEKPMQWYEPKNDGRLMLLSNYNLYRKDVVCNTKYKHFLTRCKASFENPLGEALLSRLYWVWFFKTSGFKMWAKFVEQFGRPILIGKSATNQNTEMRDALLKAHASSVLAISKTDEVNIQSASGNGGAQVHETFDKNLERRIQKVILGQTLTSGTDGAGSRALGDVHLEVQNAKYKADVRMILPTIQTIINALCDLNGWQKHTIIIGEEKSLESEKADRDVKLKNAGANLTSQYFQREYGLQDGDVAEAQVLPAPQQFTALTNQAFKFNAKPVSAEQLEVDSLADRPMQLLSDDEIKKIVASSESIEDMQEKLFSLLANVETSQFNNALDRALFTADVMGFVDSKEGK